MNCVLDEYGTITGFTAPTTIYRYDIPALASTV